MNCKNSERGAGAWRILVALCAGAVVFIGAHPFRKTWRPYLERVEREVTALLGKEAPRRTNSYSREESQSAKSLVGEGWLERWLPDLGNDSAEGSKTNSLFSRGSGISSERGEKGSAAVQGRALFNRPAAEPALDHVTVEEKRSLDSLLQEVGE